MARPQITLSQAQCAEVAPPEETRPTDLSDMTDDGLLDYLDVTKGLIETVVEDREGSAQLVLPAPERDR